MAEWECQGAWAWCQPVMLPPVDQSDGWLSCICTALKATLKLDYLIKRLALAAVEAATGVVPRHKKGEKRCFVSKKKL